MNTRRELKCSPGGAAALQMQDLATDARQAGYRVKVVADHLGYSERWLENFCRKHFGLTPRALLMRLREAEIQKLARTSLPAKVICRLVGFADTASFCHSLKRSAGCTLRELREWGQHGRSQKDNKRLSPPITAANHNASMARSEASKSNTNKDRKETEWNNLRGALKRSANSQ